MQPITCAALTVLDESENNNRKHYCKRPPRQEHFSLRFSWSEKVASRYAVDYRTGGTLIGALDPVASYRCRAQQNLRLLGVGRPMCASSYSEWARNLGSTVEPFVSYSNQVVITLGVVALLSANAPLQPRRLMIAPAVVGCKRTGNQSTFPSFRGRAARSRARGRNNAFDDLLYLIAGVLP
jgi:hypothetical protein